MKSTDPSAETAEPWPCADYSKPQPTSRALLEYIRGAFPGTLRAEPDGTFILTCADGMELALKETDDVQP